MSKEQIKQVEYYNQIFNAILCKKELKQEQKQERIECRRNIRKNIIDSLCTYTDKTTAEKILRACQLNKIPNLKVNF